MKPPAELTEKTKQIWNDIEDNARRQLNGADYALIEHFCKEVDMYDAAVAKISDKGFKNVHDQLDAVVTAANKAAANIQKLYGMIDPIMEKKLKIEKPKRMKSVKTF